MKVLKLASYYKPEQISSTHLSDDLEEAYYQAGFVHEIICPTPTRGVTKEVRDQYKKVKYEELRDGKLIVHRFSMFREGKIPILRALRYVLVNLLQYIKGCKAKNVDVTIAGSTPPTQGILCAGIARKLSKVNGKKVPFIYTLHDIFPDSLVTTGLTKKGSLLWKLGRKMEDYTYSNADKIIVISESMKRNIMGKGVPEEKIVVISNWIDTTSTKPVPREENSLFDEFGLSREKFTVVYAGNFGLAQGAEVVLQAAEALRERSDIQFVIFGSGIGFEAAQNTVAEKKLTNVTISGLLPQERVSEVYSLGSAALITCKKGVGNSGMPSKTWSIMACNTPIIASFDTDSELAEVISRANAGVCTEPQNAGALVDAILLMKQNEGGYRGGRAFVCKYASKDVCTAKYVETLLHAASAEEQGEE